MEPREVLVSPRFGEVQSADVVAVVAPDIVAVDVVVLCVTSAPITATLSVERRWAGAGWQRMIACPRCGGVAGVLYEQRGGLLCRRCCPHLTIGQRQHKNRGWTEFDGGLEAELSRTALQRRRDDKISDITTELLARDQARVDAAIADASEFMAACDQVLATGGLG